MSNIVYLLWDPRNGDVRYVGKTLAPAMRLERHRAGTIAKGHCQAWEQELIREGFCCEAAVVEEGLTHEESSVKERWWIAYAKQCGWLLINHTDGGEGRAGYKASPETIEKLRRAALGRKHSLETRAKMSATRMGRETSPETRARLSGSLTGRTLTPEWKAKLSAARKSYKQSAETIEKQRQANTGRKRGPEAIERLRQGALRREEKKRRERTI